MPIVYRELSTLSHDLGISARTLYAVSNCLNRHYRYTQIQKPDGTYRKLSIPDAVLKRIQRRIADNLLFHMPVSPYATAYRYGGGIYKNAAQHVGQPKLLKLDIYRFFDSILYSAVKETVFPAEHFSEQNRVLLTMLCYYSDALPQGAPSSPAITNILLYRFDNIVGSWCKSKNIRYTRYCDDMTFSGDFDEQEVIGFVRRELQKTGFFLNGRKTKVLRPGQRQAVTGLTVNQKVTVSAAYRRKLRQELYYCRKFGIKAHLKHIGSVVSAEAYRESLLGKVHFVLQIMPQNREMREYKNWLIAQKDGGAK